MKEIRYNARGQRLKDCCTKCGSPKSLTTSNWCAPCMAYQRYERLGNIEKARKLVEQYKMKRCKKYEKYYKAKEFIDRIENRNKKWPPHLMVSFVELFELIDVWMEVTGRDRVYHVIDDVDRERIQMWIDLKRWVVKNDPYKKSPLNKKPIK